MLTTATLAGDSGTYDIIETYTYAIPDLASRGKLQPLDELYAKYEDKYTLNELDPGLAAYVGVGVTLGVQLVGPEICGASAGLVEEPIAWLSLAGAAVGGNPMAALRLLTLETAVLAFIPLVLPAALDQQTHLDLLSLVNVGDESMPIGSNKKRKGWALMID